MLCPVGHSDQTSHKTSHQGVNAKRQGLLGSVLESGCCNACVCMCMCMYMFICMDVHVYMARHT